MYSIINDEETMCEGGASCVINVNLITLINQTMLTYGTRIAHIIINKRPREIA